MFATAHSGIGGLVRGCCLPVVLILVLGTVPAVQAATLNPSLLPRVKAATFEVVAAKPAHDPLTYAKALPLNLLPYQQRTDKYHSIGTAFAIGPNRYVTAAHVLLTSRNSLWGPLSLRADNGHVYAIGKIDKFALRRDFVVFSLVDPLAGSAVLPVDTHPVLNQTVYAVGNALGSGVTIRAGLYTSNTPEQQNGAWKWVRFSAPVSPGDSGGPLLNQDGQVVGVILGSSPGANLNYALPISQVLDAPAHLARFDHRLAYGFDLINSTISATFKGQFALPKSLAGFDATFLKLDYAWEDHELKALMAQQAGQMFPDGTGSNRLLHDLAGLGTTPWLYKRNDRGVWRSTGGKAIRLRLADNGYLAFRFAAGSALFHLRVPDNVSIAKLRDDPEALMDLILKSGIVRRDVGPDRVRITSLGKPTMDQPYTDRWQRHWRVVIWPTPYDNSDKIWLVLPVPDGYVGMMRTIKAADLHTNLISLEAMTGFFNTAYSGTLAQWKQYLSQTDVLPVMLRHVKVSAVYGKEFRYASQRIRFSFTPAVQKIVPDSILTLGCNFSRSHGKVAWGVSVIHLVAQRGSKNWINIQRHVKPSSDLGNAYQIPWNKISGQKYPWNGVARNSKGVTRITGVVLPSGNQPPSVLYTEFDAREGQQSQTAMKSRLDILMQQVKVAKSRSRPAFAG